MPCLCTNYLAVKKCGSVCTTSLETSQDARSADIGSFIPIIDDTKGDKQNNYRSPHHRSVVNLFGSAARRNKNEMSCQKALAGQSLRRNDV